MPEILCCVISAFLICSCTSTVSYKPGTEEYLKLSAYEKDVMKFDSTGLCFYVKDSRAEANKKGISRKEYRSVVLATKKANRMLDSLIDDAYKKSSHTGEYCMEINGVNVTEEQAGKISDSFK